MTTPSPSSQIARLRASGATVLVIILTPRATIQSYAVARALGWKPTQIYTNQVSATDAYLTTARNAGAGDLVEGTISIQYAKDPSNPTWANDPAVKLYRTIMSKYYPNGDSPTAWRNGSNYYGVALAHAFVQVLRKAGSPPTRAGIIKAARKLEPGQPVPVAQQPAADDREEPVPDPRLPHGAVRRRHVHSTSRRCSTRAGRTELDRDRLNDGAGARRPRLFLTSGGRSCPKPSSSPRRARRSAAPRKGSLADVRPDDLLAFAIDDVLKQGARGAARGRSST